jgi:hypothetical protein
MVPLGFTLKNSLNNKIDKYIFYPIFRKKLTIINLFFLMFKLYPLHAKICGLKCSFEFKSGNVYKFGSPFAFVIFVPIII